MTPLDKTLKRSLSVKGVDYVVTLSPETLKLTRKGRRIGLELKWADITSGESALAVALHASVGRFEPVEKAVLPRSRTSARGLPKKRPR
ncbi:MAG TPA: hypothetical protein VK715_03540 [Steroidobacteraceae bacterium]|jgi:hypothetical protein|nr:hypothetical protein [Steroidobacteraceae bacterium]